MFVNLMQEDADLRDHGLRAHTRREHLRVQIEAIALRGT